MDRAKMKSILLAMTFRNGVRVSRGKRWGGSGLSVVIFFIVGGIVSAIAGSPDYNLLPLIVATYAFWILWRHAYGKPHEFWKPSGTDTPQAAGNLAVDTAQQPITIIVEKKSSTATWVLVIIVLVVLGVVALGGCSLVMTAA